MRARLAAHGRTGESGAAFAACLVFSLLASRRLLEPDVFSDDAFVHQYWMWHWRDGALFNDPLTAQLRESVRYPEGYQALFWLATHVTGPIAFGEWLGVGLMALSGWLVFAIVRDQADWRAAPWLGAALFLVLVDLHRFYGGFPRAFVQPVVLATVLLAIRGRLAAAAAVAAGGALLYPPAAVLAVGVLCVAAVRWQRGRPRLDRRRAAFAAVAATLSLLAVLVPRLAAGGSPRVFTGQEARAYPEFGPHGTLRFFASSTLEYLAQNRSGFDLHASGLLLVAAATVLLLARPAGARLLRAEVWAMPIVSLAAFAAAQAVLFRLYLPHRYTYPIVAFCAIAVAVTLRPAWAAIGGRRAGAAAAVCGVLVVAALALTTEHWSRGSRCPTGPAVRALAALPADAVIAGDPRDMTCLPGTARRAVVTSTQLAPAYEVDAFLDGRARMFAMLRAYYGPSTEAIAELARRYGATHMWVRRDALRHELHGGGARWRAGRLPYGRFVRGLLAPGRPAALRLPVGCRTWALGPNEIYDLACVARTAAPRPPER